MTSCGCDLSSSGQALVAERCSPALMTARMSELLLTAVNGSDADIGGADGDLAFALEHQWGWQVDMVDTAAANMNGLRGRARCATSSDPL